MTSTFDFPSDLIANNGQTTATVATEPTTSREVDDFAAQTSKIIIVDDEPTVVMVVERYLHLAGYRHLVTTTDSKAAISVITHERPDIVLLDIMMPEVSGIEVLEQLRDNKSFKRLPVIVLTASSDRELKDKCLDLQVTDFLNKPVDQHDLLPRVRNALTVKAYQDHLANSAKKLEDEVKKRTAELEASRREVILCLAKAAEYRDDDTGHHIIRVGRYVAIIAEELGFTRDRIDMLELAAQLHDVGKIGIPDAILQKPGKLDPEEFERIQHHCSFGRNIIERQPEHEHKMLRKHTELGGTMLQLSRSPILELACRIALTHHERWDGNGYPIGLAGEDIPMEGRMTAIADVFDALSSKRSYKEAFPLDKCFEIMEEGRGSQFDPGLLDAFFRRREEIVTTQIECSD